MFQWFHSALRCLEDPEVTRFCLQNKCLLERPAGAKDMPEQLIGPRALCSPKPLIKKRFLDSFD